MNEMVKRVAEALKSYEADILLESGIVNPSGKLYWEGKARAAIEAMREPTSEMINVIEGMGCGCPCCYHTQNKYGYMIKAALTPPSD